MQPRPNVVLITVDSLRADHLGCYGGTPSPHLDRLARKSTLFRAAFSNGPNTPHAFPAILAGRYPLMANRLGLFDAPWTVADALRCEGYYTAGFNAANPYLSRAFHYHRGFEHFSTYLDFDPLGAARISEEEAETQTRVSVPKLDVDRYAVNPESLKHKAWVEKQMLEDVKQGVASAEQPFFLWVHWMDTHYPYIPEGVFQEAAGATLFDFEEVLNLNQRVRENAPFTPAQLNRVRELYRAAVLQVDAKTGNLLEFLATRGLDASSLVLFTADHGEEFQEHGDLQHKSKLFDELIRVPLLVRRPGSKPSEIREDLVDLRRLPSTVLEEVGAEPRFPAPGLYGRGEATSPTEAFVICEASYGTHGGTPVEAQVFNVDAMPKVYACRSLHWKVILDQSEDTAVAFHILRDPFEKEPRSLEAPPARRLHERLIEHVKWEERNRLRLKMRRVRARLI